MEIEEALRVLKKYVDKFEEEDPQFKAIKRLVNKYGLKALPLVVGNALISYRLTGRGEDYWTEFSQFFLDNPNKTLVDFLYSSKYNRAQRKQKEGRLKRAQPLLKKIEEDPERYSDLNLLLEELKKTLKAKGTEKTIVFALKMAYYVFKAAGKEVKGDVPLPMDLRISALTCASGLVDASPDEIMNEHRDEAIRKWEEEARKVGLKTLHLDALLWLPARGLREALKEGVEEARRTFAENLVRLGVDEEEAREVAKALIRKQCKP
ncbi:hypothetical protein IPA_07735 [Ignicoccus pacificus DSM 13166]|uniref:N-glycosylase/DNA lyase n=1 Tax=Ignicoccus pacificus DSM 13166 TaxID=940294 RepID=A0A977KBR0_9CREN|nr:hypothetical protein IPA_07735 [Ignicoccus pacificus DSM 13166]